MTEFDKYYNFLPESTKEYFKIFYKNIPLECKEYISEIIRLKDIDYFCGMKYASHYLYDFKYDFSRLDHSISTMLQTLDLTENFEMAIAALYHDAKTPVFSHVIDYVDEDYVLQESSEKENKNFISNNKNINKLCSRDNIDIELISDSKNFSLVDNERPRLCIDRLDGVFLNSLSWTKEITFNDIRKIYIDLVVLKNEKNEDEIGFVMEKNAKKVHDLELIINEFCHSEKDNYGMFLLADIVRHCLNNKYIERTELYELNEQELIEIINNKAKIDTELYIMWHIFTSTNNVSFNKKVKTKKRYINPLIDNRPNNTIRRLYSN